MKRVTVTFDFEGAWGMPFSAPYDLTATTARLLDLLDKHAAKAVFFVTARLVLEYSQLMKEIYRRGHEIGLHGHEHEHEHNLTPEQLGELKTHLRAAGDRLEQLIGRRPSGFRSPYLLGPKFYDPTVYTMLKQAGFKWVSNREIRLPEELARPDRLPWTAGLWRLAPVRALALGVLNMRLIATEQPEGQSGLAWLFGGRRPFARPEGLIEYPLYSPLDCDLVGFVRPESPSGDEYVRYATGVLISCYNQSAQYFNINCHDWITGTADRLQILDNVLAHISARPGTQYWLPGRHGGKA